MKNDSFKAGLTLGVCLGVAGFFLFGTDKGRKVRQELEELWEDHPDIKNKLPASLRESSFAETMQELLTEIAAGLSHISDAAELASAKKIKSKSSFKPVSKKFKGV